MDPSGLQTYLAAQKQAGEFSSTGVFSVDFESAMAKRALFSLPRPGLWLVRAVQTFLRLGATEVAITQSRTSLSLVAAIAEELTENETLEGTFRNQDDSDPRFPLHSGLLAALGQEYEITLEWTERGRRRVMTLAGASCSIEERSLSSGDPELSTGQTGSDSAAWPATVELHARPPRKGLLARIFSVVDFSAEFGEVARGCFLSPVPILLDGRPSDFATGFSKQFYPSSQFRGVSAGSGDAHLELPRALTVSLPSLDLPFPEDGFVRLMGEEPPCRCLVSLAWSHENPHRSSVCWIRDGVWVDEEPLFGGRSSPLRLTLFLPADGLATDATGLALRESDERKKRFREATLHAVTSLRTLPPTAPMPERDWTPMSDEQQRLLAAELDWMSELTLLESGLSEREVRKFRDAIEEHVELSRAASAGRNEREAYLVRPALPAEEKREKESLERWGSFLSYVPPQPQEDLYLRTRTRESAAKLKPKKFFGDVYVELRPEDAS